LRYLFFTCVPTGTSVPGLPETNEDEAGILVEEMEHHPCQSVVAPVPVHQQQSLHKLEPDEKNRIFTQNKEQDENIMPLNTDSDPANFSSASGVPDP
jgi:hypothetical protein